MANIWKTWEQHEQPRATRTEKISQSFLTDQGNAQVVGELEYMVAKCGQIMVINRSWLVYNNPMKADQQVTEEYSRFSDPNKAIAKVNEMCNGRFTSDDLICTMEDRFNNMQHDINEDMLPERLGNFRSELRQLLDKYGIDLQRSWDDVEVDWCEYVLTMNGLEASRGTLRDLIGDLVD